MKEKYQNNKILIFACVLSLWRNENLQEASTSREWRPSWEKLYRKLYVRVLFLYVLFFFILILIDNWFLIYFSINLIQIYSKPVLCEWSRTHRHTHTPLHRTMSVWEVFFFNQFITTNKIQHNVCMKIIVLRPINYFYRQYVLVYLLLLSSVYNTDIRQKLSAHLKKKIIKFHKNVFRLYIFKTIKKENTKFL